jgi:hypothetical protein
MVPEINPKNSIEIIILGFNNPYAVSNFFLKKASFYYPPNQTPTTYNQNSKNLNYSPIINNH